MYLVYDIFENIGKVNAIIFNPHESQLVENGMEVEEIPENYAGKVPFLPIDLEKPTSCTITALKPQTLHQKMIRLKVKLIN